MLDFVPLHCHSYFSFHEATPALPDLIAAAKQAGCPAVALTDKHVLSGVVDFYLRCHQAGIAPVIGCEITLQDGAHLVLLAENHTGYSNLCRLLTRETKDYQPITFTQLQARAEGVIALSGCRNGHVPGLLARDRYSRAVRAARYYAGVFPGRFYIELFHNREDDITLRRRLLRLAHETGLPVVATPNVHYINPEDHRRCQVLSSIGSLTLLNRPHPRKKIHGHYHFKSREEMNDLFGDIPEALRNSVKIAEKCRGLQLLEFA